MLCGATVRSTTDTYHSREALPDALQTFTPTTHLQQTQDKTPRTSCTRQSLHGALLAGERTSFLRRSQLTIGCVESANPTRQLINLGLVGHNQVLLGQHMHHAASAHPPGGLCASLTIKPYASGHYAHTENVSVASWLAEPFPFLHCMLLGQGYAGGAQLTHEEEPSICTPKPPPTGLLQPAPSLQLHSV